jgi:Arc/MetJ-type ribon-helix-helix transcriptional regulator
MKLSVSLPGDDVEFLDEYARQRGLESRSAALHKAVRLLRVADLGPAYEAAWDEWTSSGDSDAWNSAVGDGLSDDATR